MKAHLAYFKYMMRHKWFVFWACLRMGVPLWRAVVHDLYKFTRHEWPHYARQFFNPDGSRRNVYSVAGGYDPNAQLMGFKYAWLSHQRNPHHWQAWISIGNGGSLTALPMPETFAREMVADWIGAGRAISGRHDPRPWYEANKGKMVLHPETRQLVESLLNGV